MVDIFDDSSRTITIRLNGGMEKLKDEHVMEFSEQEKPSLRNIIKFTCKRFGCKDKAACAVIYSKGGIKLFDEDESFIKADDVLYLAINGKSVKGFAKRTSVMMVYVYSYQVNLSTTVRFWMTIRWARCLGKEVLAKST